MNFYLKITVVHHSPDIQVTSQLELGLGLEPKVGQQELMGFGDLLPQGEGPDPAGLGGISPTGVGITHLWCQDPKPGCGFLFSHRMLHLGLQTPLATVLHYCSVTQLVLSHLQLLHLQTRRAFNPLQRHSWRNGRMGKEKKKIKNLEIWSDFCVKKGPLSLFYFRS